MSKDTITITLTSDEVGEIYWALVARNDVLLKEKNDKTKPGALVRISERQYDRNNNALSRIEKAIKEMNYA